MNALNDEFYAVRNTRRKTFLCFLLKRIQESSYRHNYERLIKGCVVMNYIPKVNLKIYWSVAQSWLTQPQELLTLFIS